jgi:hypothetical protein
VNVLTTLKKTHINWGKGEHRDLLAKAIQDWLNKVGNAIDKNGEEILEAHLFANKLGIPPQTFYKNICMGNRRILGDGSCGKKKWMTKKDVLFAGCVLARADQENDGLSLKEAVDMIQELKPDITCKGACRQIIRYVLPVNVQASVLKKSAQKVQATTSNRTNINMVQQYRWHRTVQEVYNLMQTKNTGLCKLLGKSFGEIMPHFIIGLDERCLMSDCHSDLRVFAAADKKKQEKLLQDCQCSITGVRTGTVVSTTRPTTFLLKGTKRRKYFNGNYLLGYGMAPGSKVIMTKNAYMTDEAWLEALKSIVAGYHNLPHIKENPDWYVTELLDGFKSHENVLNAHKLRADSLIISLKEESNSSHVIQEYNQLTAKNDKKNATESLYNQRKAKKWQTGKAQIDQNDLVLTAMQIVRAINAKTWAALFQCVNLDPRTQVDFPVFCKKITGFL